MSLEALHVVNVTAVATFMTKASCEHTKLLATSAPVLWVNISGIWLPSITDLIGAPLQWPASKQDGQPFVNDLL